MVCLRNLFVVRLICEESFREVESSADFELCNAINWWFGFILNGKSRGYELSECIEGFKFSFNEDL
jgi:hypothetical protein